MEKEDGEFPLVGTDTIEDPKKDRVPESKLFPGTCTMEGNLVDIRIKKGPEIKQGTYDIMKYVQHNSLISHLYYYPESGHGRLVIPVIETSFENWIKTGGLDLLFDQKGDMTSLFKTIILDISDLVEKLLVKEISIKNLGIHNLYMANETNPRILVLVTEAEVQGNVVSKMSTWRPLQKIIDWCYEKSKLKMTYTARRYHGFIGSDNFNVKALKKYPENWDNFTKGEYLVALIAADQHVVRAAMKRTTITWPREMPDVLLKIIEEEGKKGRQYRRDIQFDYIILIRNIYKHFYTYNYSIKKELGFTQEGFLKKLEVWTPTVWQDIYDVIGWP